jgi:hypothetical protein
MKRVLIVWLTTLGSLGCAGGLLSLAGPAHVAARVGERHVCVDFDWWRLDIHYARSEHERFLDTVDEHESDEGRAYAFGWTSYAEELPGSAPAGAGILGPNPIRTYAWSYRTSLPLPVIVAAILAYPIGAVLIPRFRRWGRRRRGLCVVCSYDLRGNTSGVCPECGLPVGARPRRPLPDRV